MPRRPDDIDRVLAFRDVVETGGFSAAAERRGVVHSTISRQVRELEESLGAPLMNRTTRTKSLTVAGEVVFRHARELGRTLESMYNEVERLESIEGGELRVGALGHVGAALVMPAVDLFFERHPNVEVSLYLDDHPLQFHRSGFDLALTVGLPAGEQLVVRKLCDNEVCLAAAPELVERFGPPTRPTDLLEWPLVAYRSEAVEVTVWPYEVDSEIHQLEARPNLTVNDGVRLLDAVRRGRGVGYLSRFSAARDLAAGRLVELLPEVVLPPYAPVYTVKSNLQVVSARVEALERCLDEVVGEMGL